MPEPEYSIIVPAYQAADQVGLCVQALQRQSVARAKYEIIVVDDGSTDKTASVARAAGADRVLIIPHGGPATARNAGIAAARGEITLFTDADCEPPPTWVEKMVAPFANAEVIGAKGSYRTRQRALIARLVQLEYEVRYERMSHLARIDFIDTYAAAYRRNVLQSAGGFDPHYPIPSAEDIDLSFRLARAGYWLTFTPEAWVWHSHPSSLRVYLRRKGQYGLWRALLYLRYPEKIGGDTHTDPALKAQFALLALAISLLLVALFWWPAGVAALAVLTAIGAVTIPFVHWAWPRDRGVATIWPLVSILRVAMQGGGLMLGLVYHGLLRRHNSQDSTGR